MTNLQRILAGIFLAGRQGGGAILLTLVILLCLVPFVLMIALPFLAAYALIKALELVPGLTQKEGVRKW